MEIYENGLEIGTLDIENEGLYARISCKIKPNGKIRRIYLAYSYGAKYVGIPDEQGNLISRFAQKHLPKDCVAVAATGGKSEYLPWRGELDGVLIESALICENELLLPLDEAMKFPAWSFETKEINHIHMAILLLDSNGLPLPRKREDEADETMDFDNFDFDLPANVSADDGIGCEGWEADCADV